MSAVALSRYELGWAAMTFNFRGCGRSDGDFSLQGWVDDLRAAIDHLRNETNPLGIWLVGTHTGGSLATCVAANDPRINGVIFGENAAPRRLGDIAVGDEVVID